MGKRNKARFNFVFAVCIVFILSGCKSTLPILPNTGTGTTAIRDDVQDITRQQADIVGTVGKIAASIDNVAIGVDKVKVGVDEVVESLGSGTADSAAFDDIIKCVRDRPATGTHTSGENTSDI